VIDLHTIDDPIALAEAVLALPCTNEGEAQALGAHAHRLAEMLADAADEAKAADTHRDLNRRIAEVLGLTGWRTDPETGEAFLPSWHDMPEKVEALVKEQERLRGELAWHEEMNGTRAEQDALDAEADALDAAADALTPEQIRAELIEVGLDPDRVAREAEVSARLIVRWMQARDERDEARLEADAFATYRALTTTALGIDAASCADDVREAIEALNVRATSAERSRDFHLAHLEQIRAVLDNPSLVTAEQFTHAGRVAALQRELTAAKMARDEARATAEELRLAHTEQEALDATTFEALLAEGQQLSRSARRDAAAMRFLTPEAQAEHVSVGERPSNHLLTLTPYLLSRIEALGYTPGETPSGVLPWLVAELEHQRGSSAMLEAIARPGPLITGFAPDAVNVRDRLLGWLITAYAMELKEHTPEQAPNNIALAMGFPADHPLHGYRVEMAVARPEKPTPREQLDEARKELTEAQKSLARWESEATYLLDHTPGAIRVREGGGPENLRASLSVTWMKLLEAVKKYVEVLKPVGEVNVSDLRKRYGERVVPPCRICGAQLTLAEADFRRAVYACPGGDWSTGKWAPFVEGRTLADAHYSASRIEIPNGDPDVIALLNTLLTERAKPRPWLINETEGSTCVAATSQETAWAAYQATIGEPVEFDDTEYHVHEVTVKHVDEMLDAALTADEELHKAKKAARIAEKDAEEKGKVLDEIRTALGNGADEALWPPGKTLGEAVKLLATMPFEVRALAKHYDRDGDFWSCLRCGGMWPRDIVTACATCHQSGSTEGVLIQAGADVEGPRPEGCDCANPPPYPGAPGAWGVSCACPIHGDEDDIEEEPVEGEDAP